MVQKDALYFFRLVSDDGSKLVIDDSLVINNDGIHSDDPKNGNMFLKKGMHTIRLDYFQGPRSEIALQLYYNLDSTEEQIFPGNLFILYTPKPFHLCPWLYILLVILVLVIWYMRKKYLEKNQGKLKHKNSIS